MARHLWDRLPDESSKAHNAFLRYIRLPVESRSIDEAWRTSPKDRPNNAQIAPRHWQDWASKYNWVARVTAHDAYLSQREQAAEDEKWIKRRLQMRERDWQQGDDLRNHAELLRSVVAEAIPNARSFVHSRRTVREDGTIIQTLIFDIVGLGNTSDAVARIVERASKVQRLATNEPTENIHLSGAALDAIIDGGMASLADIGKAGAGETDTGEVSGEVSESEAGRMAQEQT